MLFLLIPIVFILIGVIGVAVAGRRALRGNNDNPWVGAGVRPEEAQVTSADVARNTRTYLPRPWIRTSRRMRRPIRAVPSSLPCRHWD